MPGDDVMTTRAHAMLCSAATAALLLACVANGAMAQQAQQKQAQPAQKQRPAQPPATPAAQPKRAPAAPLSPAAQQQLVRDRDVCFEGRDLAALERACTNVLANLIHFPGLENVDRGHFYFNRSKARIAQSEIGNAVEDLRKAISDDYNPHVAYTQLGQLYLNRQADSVQAEASYRKALELDPNYRDARVGLALTLLRKRDATGRVDVSGAVNELNVALAQSPGDAELHFQKGLALSQGTSLDDAMRSLDEALRLRPGYTDALITRAQLNMDRGQRQRAIADLDAIIATNPADTNLLAGLGAAYTQLKQYDRAIEICDRALRVDVKNVTAHVCLGYAYTNKGDVGRAADSFERALQWEKASVIALIGRGYLRKRSGNFPSAEADFRQALAIDKKSVEAHRNLISLYTDTGELDRALLSFEETNSINGRDPWAYYLRAFARALKGDATGAKRDIEQAFVFAGTPDSDSYLARGTVAYFVNDTAGALADVREAVRLNPDNGQAHRMLARILLKRGDVNASEAALKRAEQLLPNDWNVMRNWGLIWLTRKNYDKAREYLDRSIELNGAFIESYAARGRAYEESRLVDLAKGEYERGLTKLDYDNDGREARDDIRRRLAALAQPPRPVQTPQPTSTPPPVADARPAQQPPAARTETAAAPAGPSLMCRVLARWAGQARDYAGVEVRTGCAER